MRALVISDTHFGAWTGEDILRHEHELALLAGHLDEVDEVVFLGDLFDFLFASVRDAVAAAEGLFSLLRDKLQGKRFVFLAGNHDHHLVAQQAEQLRDLELVSGESSQRKAWPGTAVLIDSDEPAPRLLEIRKHLSPLERSQAPI